MIIRIMATLSVALILLLTNVDSAAWSQSADEERTSGYLYDATIDTVFDVIIEEDPTSFLCLSYRGRKIQQIWDKRVDSEPLINTYSFLARFSDGHEIEIAVNPEFSSEDAARTEAMRYVTALGQLPTVLRKGIKRFSIHKGDKGFHAGTGQMVAYSGTANVRIAARHLEETIFHESVHSTWDNLYRKSPEWMKAQKEDGRFLTKYGLDIPHQEDLAETALFAFALLRYPGRIPPADTDDIKIAIPHRLTFLDRLFSSDDPSNQSPTVKDVCS